MVLKYFFTCQQQFCLGEKLYSIALRVGLSGDHTILDNLQSSKVCVCVFGFTIWNGRAVASKVVVVARNIIKLTRPQQQQALKLLRIPRIN